MLPSDLSRLGKKNRQKATTKKRDRQITHFAWNGERSKLSAGEKKKKNRKREEGVND